MLLANGGAQVHTWFQPETVGLPLSAQAVVTKCLRRSGLKHRCFFSLVLQVRDQGAGRVGLPGGLCLFWAGGWLAPCRLPPRMAIPIVLVCDLIFL